MISTDLELKTCDTLAEVAYTAPRSLLQKYDKIKLELAGLIRESIIPAEVDEQLREEGTELRQAGETALTSRGESLRELLEKLDAIRGQVMKTVEAVR